MSLIFHSIKANHIYVKYEGCYQRNSNSHTNVLLNNLFFNNERDIIYNYNLSWI